jgi:lysine 2,3-aminomutase
MNTKVATEQNQTYDIQNMLSRQQFSNEIVGIIEKENLLPPGLLTRLHGSYPNVSGLFRSGKLLFSGKDRYSGIDGFREIVEILRTNKIELQGLPDREFFIEVYRFMATKHILNAIDWSNFERDTLYQLVIPQPGMIAPSEVLKYTEATSDSERQIVVEEYQRKTNPHDGNQKLNKPWYINDDDEIEIIKGSQHKYPPIQLILDKTTQNCFAFCTYCFRHAQVRGDEDMFVQHDVAQIHGYLKQHKEITDILLTGGDAGYLSYERLAEYVEPIINDPELMHIKTVRIGTRVLTFHPELILSQKYTKILELMRKVVDNGIQVVFISHFSTPREVLNPATIAALRRLKAHGLTLKSQSPIMNHISLFTDDNGKVDIDRTANNWIDLGNILGILGVGFHSMYCARPTGEHHYFTSSLADINKVFSKVFRSLSSVNRPSRYITMTSSAGKISLMGTTVINGEKLFVLKFNEARNMEWIDQVFLAKYDEKENTIEKLKPYGTDKYFFEDELKEIERKLSAALQRELKTHKIHD